MKSDQCLKCLSEEVDGSSVDIYENGAIQEVLCLSCETVWFNIYKLSNQIEVKEEQP